jgi:hypothetical protein
MRNQREDMAIQRVAQDLITQYAEEAELIAAGHADTMLDLGDVEAFETWRTVMSVVRILQTHRTGDQFAP